MCLRVGLVDVGRLVGGAMFIFANVDIVIVLSRTHG